MIQYIYITIMEKSMKNIYISKKRIYTHILFFHTLFHYSLLQDTEYSSLCYMVGNCLHTLYIVVLIH